MTDAAQRGQRGYSLIEVLIAAVLIGIAIVGVFQAVSHGSRMSRQDFLMRRAYQHLEQILEDPRHSYKGNYYTDAVAKDQGELVAGTHDLGTIVLDDRDTPLDPKDDLEAESELEVTDLAMSVTIQGVDAGKCCNGVRAKKLTARIIWFEGGEYDTASLETVVSLVGIN